MHGIEIHKLDVTISNKIAAGEVVERPYNVVKELVENSIDAGATLVRVDIADGGTGLIRISDNGKGIHPDDLPLAVQRFATSKISTIEDVYAVSSYGFRGEALAAISSVSDFSIQSRREGCDPSELRVHFGEVEPVRPSRWVDGTIITVKELFDNVPARKKFLKSPQSQQRDVVKFLRHFSMIRPETEFRLTVDGAEAYHAPLGETMLSRCKKVMKETDLVYGEASYGPMSVKLVAGLPTLQKLRKDQIVIGVNGRLIRDVALAQAVIQAYHRLMPQGKFPVCVVALEIRPDEIDVNVHPAKLEVKFSQQRDVFSFLHDAVTKTISADDNRNPAEPIDYQVFVTPKPTSGNPVIQTKEPSHHGEYTLDLTTQFENDVVVDVSAQRQYQPEPSVVRDLFAMPETARTPDDFTVIGQLYDTVIVVQKGDEVLFIDQHVAHERTLFEQYEKQASITRPTVVLHEPLLIDLTDDEMDAVTENGEMFTAFGFAFEPFGGETIKITQVPADMMKRNVAKEVRDMVTEMADLKKSRVADYSRVVLSCKNAVKAGEKLSPYEMETIVRDLFKTSNPYTCPHGRPIIHTIAKDALMRKFDR